MSRRLRFTLLALVTGTSFAGAGVAADSLYARLGGAPKVTAFVRAAVEDSKSPGADVARDGDVWIAHICALGGGGCPSADLAARAPAGTIEALRRAMRAQDVPLSARNELLDLLAATPRNPASP